jgi:hypothetical protein
LAVTFFPLTYSVQVCLSFEVPVASTVIDTLPPLNFGSATETDWPFFDVALTCVSSAACAVAAPATSAEVATMVTATAFREKARMIDIPWFGLFSRRHHHRSSYGR